MSKGGPLLLCLLVFYTDPDALMFGTFALFYNRFQGNSIFMSFHADEALCDTTDVPSPGNWLWLY